MDTKLNKQLRKAIETGGLGLAEVPNLVRNLIKAEGWKPEFSSFQDYIPEALGTTFDDLFRICDRDFDCLCLMDEQLMAPCGAKSDLIELKNQVLAPTGNSKRAAIRKLRKNAPGAYKQLRNAKGDVSTKRVRRELRAAGLQFPSEEPHHKALAAYRALSAPEKLLFWIGIEEDRPAASNAAQDVLSRLKESPATAPELNAIAGAYRQRISDLRKLGHKIEHNRGTRPATYRLV